MLWSWVCHSGPEMHSRHNAIPVKLTNKSRKRGIAGASLAIHGQGGHSVFSCQLIAAVLDRQVFPSPPDSLPPSSVSNDDESAVDIHYIDVIMTTMSSQITSLTVVYSTVYSDADQIKHQSSASLTFVWGIHRDRWIPRTKGQLCGKCFHLMTSSCGANSILSSDTQNETLDIPTPSQATAAAW